MRDYRQETSSPPKSRDGTMVPSAGNMSDYGNECWLSDISGSVQAYFMHLGCPVTVCISTGAIKE